jgi:N-acetylglutamate synthase-like GNAT family acetyltransferase
MDVIVDDRYRRKGIGQTMIKYILNHQELRDVYQWVLLTKDAHGVYQKVGFTPISDPDKWMENRKPRPNRS